MSANKKWKTYQLTFPEIILNDKDLSALDRLLLALIITYDKQKGCFASNARLASFVNCSSGTVSKSIKKMQKMKYIIYNRENKDQGGRGYIRKVRNDLKIR